MPILPFIKEEQISKEPEERHEFYKSLPKIFVNILKECPMEKLRYYTFYMMIMLQLIMHKNHPTLRQYPTTYIFI